MRLVKKCIVAATIFGVCSQISTGATSAKKAPMIQMGTSQNAFNLGAEEQYLAWSKWHKRVGKAISKQIKKAVGNKFGKVKLSVVITKDHNLSAIVLDSSSKPYGDDCLESVSLLSGDPVLQFPDGSMRDNIAFDYEFKKTLFGLPREDFIENDFEKVSHEDVSQESKSPTEPGKE